MNFRKDVAYESGVQFGVADLAGDGAYMNILDDYFWSGVMEGAGKFGGPIYRFANSTQADKQGTALYDGLYTIFDSSSEDILLSSIYFDSMVDRLCNDEDYNCKVKDGRLHTTCDINLFPDIVFRVGGIDVMARSMDIIVDEHQDDFDW